MKVISNSGNVVIGDLSMGGSSNVVVRENRVFDLSQFFSDEELKRSKWLKYCIDKNLIRVVDDNEVAKVEANAPVTTEQKIIEAKEVNKFEIEVKAVDDQGNIILAQPEKNEQSGIEANDALEDEAIEDNPYDGIPIEEFLTQFKELGHWSKQRAFIEDQPLPADFLKAIAESDDFPNSVRLAATAKMHPAGE